MFTPIKAILLRNVRYSDTKSIATLWTLEHGRVSVLMPSGTSRASRRLAALMVPLATLEAVASFKPGREIGSLRDVGLLPGAVSLSGKPVKSMVAMFLADFLYVVLRENQPDELLSRFLFDSVAFLGSADMRQTSNFHLYFLYGISRYLGIEPDMGSWRNGRCFDMQEGIFTDTAPLHRQYIESDDARAVWLLSRLNRRNLHLLRLTREQRNRILDGMLRYYSVHYARLTTMSSLRVIRDVML